MDSYHLTNARLTWSDIRMFGGSVAASLWVKNLADEEYILNATSEFPHTARAVMYGAERNFGIDLSYEY